jgi:hypothetical protein
VCTSIVFTRSPLRDRGELAARLVVRPESADGKPARIDSGGIELGPRTRGQIAGQESEQHVVPRVERVEQFGNSRHESRAGDPAPQLVVQVLDVARQHAAHVLVDVLVGVALHAHQLADDLRIGLAVEAMLRGSCAPEYLDQRALHGPTARAVGQQDRSVDVEQDESHVRVSKRPVMMHAMPIPCHTVGVSFSITHATATAMIG